MALTETEQQLINGLKAFKVIKGTGAQIFVMLGEEARYREMIGYMVAHRKATPEELLEQTRRIAKQTE